MHDIPPPQTIRPGQPLKELKTSYYNKSVEVTLGYGHVEESGALVVIPSDGHAGTVKQVLLFILSSSFLLLVLMIPRLIHYSQDALLFDYANNDFWYDTTADGPVEASVSFRPRNSKQDFVPLPCKRMALILMSIIL